MKEALVDWEERFGPMDYECTSSLSSIEILRGDDWDHTGELCGGGGVSGCI